MGKITTTGYETNTREETKLSVQDIWKKAFGPNINLEVSTPQGQIIEIMTDVLCQIDNARQDDFNARDIYKAQGIQLDIIGREIGAPRKESIPTQLVVSITGQTGYTIPSGSLFNMVNDVEQKFRTNNDIVVTSSPQSATLVATDGSVYGGIQVGDLLQTVEYFQQVSNIQINSIVAGKEKEDDNTYRARLIELKDSGIDDIANLKNKLMAINNVIDVNVKQNNSLDTDQYGIPSHSIEVIVLGGDEQDIGQVCLENVVMGTPTYLNPSGGVSINVVDQQGYTQVYNITRPSSVEFSVEVTYAVKPHKILSNAEAGAISDRISDYLSTRYIGQTVYISDITYQILDGIQDIIELVDLKVYADNVQISESYTMGIREYATVGTITVEEDQ